ncbi:MAG: hypothetical protein JXP36_04700 [Bacteroidales bacterium]|nr:hypothetical protein [Bacteroidales bacterium]
MIRLQNIFKYIFLMCILGLITQNSFAVVPVQFDMGGGVYVVCPEGDRDGDGAYSNYDGCYTAIASGNDGVGTNTDPTGIDLTFGTSGTTSTNSTPYPTGGGTTSTSSGTPSSTEQSFEDIQNFDPCDIDFSSPETSLQGVGFLQAELRAMYPILPEGLGLTSSASLGLMLDRKGGIGMYYTGSLGVSNGVGVVGGVSGGVMFNVESIQEMQGLGLNTGYLFAWNGIASSGEINLINTAPELSSAAWDKLRLGVTSSYLLPADYIGAGAGAYIDISYTSFIYSNSSSSIETLTQQFNSILPINITQNDLLMILNLVYNNLWDYNESVAKGCN